MSNSVGFLGQAVTGVVAATTTAASYTWPTTDAALADTVRVYNAATVVVYVTFSKSSAGVVSAVIPTTTTAANGMPVPPGGSDHQISFFRVPPGVDTVSVICGTASAGNVYFTKGDGGV